MSTKRRTMILGIAALLAVSLFSGCGKDDKKPDTILTNSADSAQTQENEAEKPLLDNAEKISSLEETLIAEFECIEKVKITQVESEYHVKLTLTSPEKCINDELKDTIISRMVQSYGGLTEDQIIIEVADNT